MFVQLIQRDLQTLEFVLSLKVNLAVCDRSEMTLQRQKHQVLITAPQCVNPSLNFLLSTRGKTGLKQQSPQVKPPYVHNVEGEKWREIFYSSPKQSLCAP